MTAVAEDSQSFLFRALRMIVLLSAPIMAGMVQLAVIPAQTGMAAYFSSKGVDGAFAAQNVMTIAAPAMAFGAPLIGWLAGKLGKRNTLLAAMLIYGVAGMAGAYAPDLYSLLATRLILGIAAAGYVTIAVSFIGDYYPGEDARGRLLGWFAIVGGGGSLVVLFVAGLLTKMGDWHSPFILYAIPLALLVMAVFLIHDVKQLEGAHAAAAGSDSIWGAWGIYALITLIAISMYAVTIQGTYMMAENGVTDPSTQSNVMLFSTVGSMAGAYLFRFVRPALGFHMTLALTWAFLAVGNIGFPATASFAVLAACSGAVGMASGLMQPLTQTTVLNMVSPSASARAMGMALGCIFLGQFIHPFVVKPLTDSFGLHGAFVWLGGASAVAAVLAALWRLRGGVRAAA
ncbi:MAG TPA: MFS transporter [Alphaproteobacteria bacterium]|jgi:MFS family permease|nr:MFS transporter [Alphaproteobacteria bacterium]